MKCDELEEEYLWTNNVKTPSTRMVRAYDADEVDKAIAELKARIQLDDDEMAGFLQLEEECGGGDLRNYIAELKARIADLEKLNHDLCERVTENDDIRLHWEEVEQTRAANERLKAKLEDVQASAYTESVDAGMRERRLRRALWLARAELCRRLDVDRYLRKHLNSWYNENLLTFNDACVAMEVKMCDAESKCRAKAEEYK